MPVTVAETPFEGLVAGILGRHELYVESLAALLEARGAEVHLLDEHPATSPVLRRLAVLLVESPLPSELEAIALLGPPVIALGERSSADDVKQARALGARGLLNKAATLAELSLAIGDAAAIEAAEPVSSLTRRQHQVLRLLAEGLDNAEIAGRLGISTRTVRSHVSSLLERMGASNRTQAAVTALKKGMIVFALVLAALAATIATPPPAAAADASLAARVKAQMRPFGAHSGAWVADAQSGTELVARREDSPRAPASVQKLFTTATALERLGSDVRIDTVVHSDGVVTPDGTLLGSLYVKGFGDPSFGRAALARLAAKVRASGVRRITGRVFGDESFFDSRRGLPAAGFRTSAWVGPLSALSFEHGILRGFGGGFQTDPPRFVAGRFRAALASRGVKAPRAVRSGQAPPDSSSIASVLSPSVGSLVRHTNSVSDNYFAEMLVKGLGARFGELGSTLAGAAVVRGFERSLGLSSRVLDGSGLSRSDAVSPRTVGRLLLKAQDEPWFDSFYGSLPVAGHSGTLRKRMRGTAASGRCRAKTGSLIGVSALAGYCRTASGRRLAFALLMNGVSVWRARTAQDRIAAALASYQS